MSFEKEVYNHECEVFLKRIGNFIRTKRISKGHSSAETFANTIDMDVSQLRKYERGEIAMTLSTLYKILYALKEDNEDILQQFLFLHESKPLKEQNRLSQKLITQVKKQVEMLNGEKISDSLQELDIVRLINILEIGFNKNKKTDIVEKVGLSSKSKNFNIVFKIALDNKWIAMTIPENKNSPLQRYYTTEKGKEVLILIELKK